jgi:uncharacterized protein
MIHVTIYKDGYHIIGHAEFDEYGKDIVCSAVSVLAQVIADNISSYTDVNIQKTSGNLRLLVTHETIESKVLLRTFDRGMRLIEQSYPQNVKITWISENMS